jgi:tight adherence protein B
MRVVAALAAFSIPLTLAMPRRLLRTSTVVGALSRIGLGLTAGVIGYGLATASGAPSAVSVAVGVLVTPIPHGIRTWRRRRASHQIADRWADFLAAVRTRVAGGSPIPEATRSAGRHLGGRFADLDRGWGASFSDTMQLVRDEWDDPIADRVFMTVVTAATVGGGRVDGILAHLAASIAADVRLRRAHDAALTQQRLTARVALLAPWAILILTLATNPTAATSYAAPAGTTIVAGGLAATTIGYVLAVRTARLSEPPRLFR